jgi:hypothetical protein
VIGLWIGIGSLWNLEGPWRRSPAGRWSGVVSAQVPLIRKKRGYDAQGFDLRFHPRQLDFFQPNPCGRIPSLGHTTGVIPNCAVSGVPKTAAGMEDLIKSIREYSGVPRTLDLSLSSRALTAEAVFAVI